MIRCAAALLFCLAAAAPVWASEADDRLAALVAQVRGGDTAVDYTALRDAYAQSAGYDPYGEQVMDDHKAMFARLSDGDCPAASAAADRVLAVNYIHASGHFIRWVCAMKDGRERDGQFHRAVLTGLMKSVTGGRDGRTPASAFSVVSVDEEYALLRFFRLHPGRQQLVHADGSLFDLLEFSGDDGRHGTWLFNIDRPRRWLAARFPEKSE